MSECINAVEFHNVSKIYELNNKNKFYGIKDLTFSVEKGEIVGILGSNGSGKSTLSSIIAGISYWDEGKVEINGEQALIAINSGLSKQLTGIENIKYKGALLGLSRRKISQITKKVIEFSELGEFINQPVKNYSSGMKARLGFSISIFLDPEILIIDEALSVGDSAFTEKCIEKIVSLGGESRTIFFVSHSLPQVKKICTKALWIENGLLREYGDIDKVGEKYSAYMSDLKLKTKKEKKLLMDKAFKKRIV